MNIDHRPGLGVLSLAAIVLALTGCDRSREVPEETSGQMAAPKQKAPPEPAMPPGGYTLSVESAGLDGNRLRATFTTNIPGTIEVMASVNLAGQKPDDPWVGKSERVTLRDGSGAVTFDTSDLPSGHYEVEASFYPRWGLKDATAQGAGVAEELEATQPITLAGSGESAAAEVAKKSGQKWVMENIIIGTRWDAADWQRRFGNAQQVTVSERFNPRIIKAYYFPSIDTTVFVNTLKGEVSHWRLGRATE